MKGKTCVVTGPGSGVGRAIAVGLGALGARVVLVGRDVGRLAALGDEIRAAGGASDHRAADLALAREARRVGADLAASLDRVDVLVHNAAVIPRAGGTTPEGLEIGFAVNTVAPYVLTTTLAPVLVRSAPSRVIHVVGARPRVDLDDGQRDDGGDGRRSRDAGLLVLHALSRRFAGQGVDVLGAFPGRVRDDGVDAAPGLAGLARKLARPLLRTPARGAASTLWAASSPDVVGRSGTIFAAGGKERRIAGWNDDAQATRLVAQIEAMIRT